MVHYRVLAVAFKDEKPIEESRIVCWLVQRWILPVTIIVVRDRCVEWMKRENLKGSRKIETSGPAAMPPFRKLSHRRHALNAAIYGIIQRVVPASLHDRRLRPIPL